MEIRSPFKLLEAYGKEDKEIFFGREEEIETLYQMTFQTNLLLVYGMSGTGKTSLVRCGLANRIDDSDWYDIYIRRQKDVNNSFEQELKVHDRDQSFEAEFSIPDMVKSLYLDYLKPIYLIFDQFEELFILGDEKEYATFVDTIAALLAAELPCKVLIIMREEYLAHLSTFEKKVPKLFDKRLRVEPMTLQNARRVIINTTRSTEMDIHLADEEVADTVLEYITEGKGRVKLTYLQVFLDKMFRVAAKRNANRIVFDKKLVAEVGRIEDVLIGFLGEQIEIFEQEFGTSHIAYKFLKCFVSDKGTKVPILYDEVGEKLPELGNNQKLELLNFFLRNRILRPLDNNQYELTHDSIAYKLFKTKTIGIKMPHQLPDYGELPSNPFLRFEPIPKSYASIFFGRDEEVQELFDMVVNDTDIRTTLVFGPMGVGKSSLIQAGLLPRVEQLFPSATITISRELIQSDPMQQMFKEDFDKSKEPLLLQMAFQYYSEKPNQEERKIIILDQFEELFIWVDEHEQLTHFYQHIHHLLHFNWNVDLIIVVRDEFFAQLQDLEFYLPGILDEQMRIKHIDHDTAREIVQNIATQASWEFSNDQLVDRIVDTIEEEDGRVNLTYLQLYMDKLYHSVQS